MSEQAGAAGLVETVLAGGNRKLQLLAAQGLLPLAQAELVPVQVQLASSEDKDVAGMAVQALSSLEPQLAAQLINDGAQSEVIAFLARSHRHAVVLEAVVRSRAASRALLAELATGLEPDLQEILLLRQDAIIENPELLDALETNPQLSSFARRRIQEYRDHLLPRAAAAPKSREELELEADGLTEDQVEIAIVAAKAEGTVVGEIDETTGLSEAQLRSLPVAVRLKLSRGASPSTRSLLLRDPNPMVATSVLRNNPVPDSEIERVAANRSVVPEVLEAISRERKWTRKYSVVLGLARNPRTPAGVALRLLPRLAVRDLRQFTRDRNVANAVRTAAQRLYKIKRH